MAFTQLFDSFIYIHEKNNTLYSETVWYTIRSIVELKLTRKDKNKIYVNINKRKWRHE